MTRSPKKLLKRIRECEKQIDNLKTLPYYILFKQQEEQQNDIAAVMQKLEKLKEELTVSSRSLQESSPQPLSEGEGARNHYCYYLLNLNNKVKLPLSFGEGLG